MSPFLQLLNIALGNRTRLDKDLSADEWQEVIESAKKQAVIGLVHRAMMVLPPEQMPERKQKVSLALLSEKISALNGKVNTHIKLLYQQCSDLNLRSCLLKGQGLAALYPCPDARQSGDIDMWVDADHETLIALARNRWPLGAVCYHHIDAKVFDKGPAVEFHIFPTWLNSPRHNRLFHKYLDEVKDRQFSNFNPQLGCNTPTVDFNLVFNMLHLYRHLLQEGIGLRQFIDYYYILRHSDEQSRKTAYGRLCELGLATFCGAVMYLLQELFFLDGGLMLCEPDAGRGEFLIREVELSGNFGTRDERNRYRRNQNIFLRAVNRMRHLSRYFSFATSEVLWAPYFKVRQYVWRLINFGDGQGLRR